MRDYLTKKELMCLSLRSIERLQRKRFIATVRHLLPHTRAYSELFDEFGIKPKKIHKVEDWKKLGIPLFKKKYYIKHPDFFVVSPDAEEFFHVHKNYLGCLDKIESLKFMMSALFRPKKTVALLKSFYGVKMPFFSGGTESGSPTPVFITSRQKYLMEKVIGDVVSVINGVHDFGDINLVGMNLFPYGPHLAWHAANLAINIACDLNLSTAAGGAISTERLALLAENFKPKIFVGMHEYMKHRFFPAVADNKTKLPMSALIINGASKMSDGDRLLLAKSAQRTGIVQPTVLDIYGASELKEDLMTECLPNSGFHHVSPLSNIIRTVKAESADEFFIKKWEFTKPQDGGYAVIWTIDGAGTLFEGYLLGDHYGKISQDKCQKCGLNVERIYDVNRIRDVVAQQKFMGIVEQKIKGAKVNLSALRDRILEYLFVKEVQMVVDKSGKKLTIRFASNLTPHSAVVQLRKSLLDLEITPELECVSIDELVSKDKKFEPFVVE